MSMMWYVAAVTVISGVVSTGVGGLLGAVACRDSSRIISLLLSFAGGIMLSLVTFDLLPEALGTAKTASGTHVAFVMVSVLVGYLVVLLLKKAVEKYSPETSDAVPVPGIAQKTKLRRAGILMFLAIALHNFPEGMVIGATFAPGGGALTGGILMAILIGLHDVPEGMAVSVPLVAGGISRPMAVLLSAASGIPTILGAVTGYWLGVSGPLSLSFSLGFAGGAMLCVVFSDLIPEALAVWHSDLSAFAVLLGVISGVAVIYL